MRAHTLAVALVAAGALLASGAQPAGAIPAPSFTTNLGSGTGAVYAMALQADGKVLIGGQLFAVNGAPVASRMARLTPNGSLDTAFNSALGTGFDGAVTAIVVQPDGKILVGGRFITLDSTVHRGLVRLNADGTPDTAFNANVGIGFDNDVFALALQPDGKILAGGNFSNFKGTNVPDRLVRLNANGTLDAAFNSALGTGVNGLVLCVVVQPDGKILVGGGMNAINGVPVPGGLARLSASGAVGAGFTAALGTGFIGTVNSVALRSNGSILVGGSFAKVNGAISAPDNLYELTPSGAASTAFNAKLGTGLNADVQAVSLRPDGSAVVGGDFTALNGASVPARLVGFTASGSRDTTFTSSLGSGFSDTVDEVRVRANGTIAVGGSFTTSNGAPPSGLTALQSQPSKPRNVAAVRLSAATRVTWASPLRPGGRITGYTAVATAPGRPTKSCTTTGATTRKCTISGLTGGVTYQVRVRARNAVGPSAPAAAVTVVPSP